MYMMKLSGQRELQRNMKNLISTESYYEEYLKDKTKEQIMTTIRGIKQEIGRLKNTMEGPNYRIKPNMYPSEDTRIHWTRQYLKIAKQTYAEAGGIYVLSKSEEKAVDFDANLDSICKITFIFGGYFSGYRNYTVELSDGLKANTKLWEDEEPLCLYNNENQQPYTKDTFIFALKSLYMGEWRRRYSTKRFGYIICDGTQWELKFEYNNGHKAVRFDGDNSYPYNFHEFKMLFGINDGEEDEDN